METVKLKSKTLIQPPDVLAIGSSTGGLQALSKLFEDLKGCDIDIPILITQHIPENFDKSFSNKIESISGRKVIVPKDGEKIEKGIIYFAPSEKHMLVNARGGGYYVSIDDSPPVNFCKPAVDPMFKSIARAYGKNILSVILTGIGSDGLEGAKEIVAGGGTLIAQDQSTSVVWGMPGAVAKANICTEVLPLDKIAGFIKDFSFGKVRENLKIVVLPHHFSFMKEYFLKKSGMHIGDDKAYLIDTRLTPLIKKHKLKSLDELIQKIKDNNKEIIAECLDAILTNETYFFRDPKLYNIFETDIISMLVDKCAGDTIRIWSSACSSGQEPYSIAISLLENIAKLKGKKFEISASDISGKVLKKAIEGTYNSFEIQRGMPENLVEKYFDKINEQKWKIKDEVKKYVKFNEQNLIESFSYKDKFDCVFCRYVLIYFDEQMKKNILKKVCEATKPMGAVLLGASETNNLLPEQLNQYEKLRSVFFRKQ